VPGRAPGWTLHRSVQRQWCGQAPACALLSSRGATPCPGRKSGPHLVDLGSHSWVVVAIAPDVGGKIAGVGTAAVEANVVVGVVRTAVAEPRGRGRVGAAVGFQNDETLRPFPARVRLRPRRDRPG